MTEYRTINDGYWDFLQYKITKKNFWGKTVEKWLDIRDARFSRIYMLEDFFGFDRYVCSYNHNLTQWIKQYPDVNMWFVERERLIQENSKKRYELSKRIEDNKGKINYL